MSEDRRRLLISFSGGETSAYMTYNMLRKWAHGYDEIKVVFANTGQENEATLEFVDMCDRQFGFGTVWVEAVVHHGKRKACTAKVTSFERASRDGQPFEDVIQKYGVPNQAFPHCTRELKLSPIYAYTDALGWARGSYDVAVGIRADEIDRMAADAQKRRIIYPLIKPYPTTKPQINTWWAAQPFRLSLKGYEGNCKWCWKKSDRKLLTILQETPNVFAFPARMERLYGRVGPEFKRHAAELPADYSRTFFRKNRSALDLIDLSVNLPADFRPADDDASVYDPEWDTAGGCGESCEVFTDED